MFTFQHFRFSLESKTPLQMPVHNKGNVIRAGFGSTFRLSAARLPERGQVSAQAERIVCHGNFQRRVRDRVRELKNRTAEKKPGTGWFTGAAGEIGEEECLDV
ncbi:MAG: hypothetical protein Q8S00_31250 [Deltaproteobacteria bacterium]|nr:hypothetical protein [Deltaproteobacteria bacterium]